MILVRENLWASRTQISCSLPSRLKWEQDSLERTPHFPFLPLPTSHNVEHLLVSEVICIHLGIVEGLPKYFSFQVVNSCRKDTAFLKINFSTRHLKLLHFFPRISGLTRGIPNNLKKKKNLRKRCLLHSFTWD